MKTITFTPELDSYIKKDGSQNIMIRITQDGKHKRVGIGHSVKSEMWDNENKLVRRKHPLSSMLNDLIKIQLAQLDKKYLGSKLQQQQITAKQLQNTLKNNVLGDNYFKYAKNVISRFTNVNTRDAQNGVLNGLKEYLKGSEELYFADINYEFLEEYKAYLKRKKLSTNTIWSIMKTLRARYNDGLKAGIFRPEVNPFTLIDIKRAKSKRVRFSEEQIKKIEDFMPSQNLVMFDARNVFLFSYLHWGMRVSDVLNLKFVNIVNGRLIYTALKTQETQKNFNIKIHPRAEKIIQFYLSQEHKPSDFLFPFLRKLPVKHSDLQFNQFIASKTTLINKNLRKMATLLELPKFSTNSARHSFAEIVRGKMDKKSASMALGHSSEKVTEAYFNSASEYRNDELSDAIY
ncbi:phage integrase SAM-like domain-containing protein [Emticicia fontis]